MVDKKDAINWSKVTVKSFVMLQNISISNNNCNNSTISINKRYSFEHSMHQRILQKYHIFHQIIKQFNYFQHW